MPEYNAAERAHVKDARKAAKIAERQSDEFTAYIMSTTQGRAWMWDKLSACHVFASSFTTNAMQLSFNEGERNAGLRLLSDIMRVAPDQFIAMTREANDRSHTADSRRGNSPEPGRHDPGPVAVVDNVSDDDEPDDKPTPDIYDEYNNLVDNFRRNAG